MMQVSVLSTMDLEQNTHLLLLLFHKGLGMILKVKIPSGC